MQEIEERIRSLQSYLRTVLDIYRAYEKDFRTREMGNLYETTPIYKTNGFKIGVAVVAGCVVLAVVAFPGVAIVIGAAVGSAIGAVSGGLIGGITAETKGGNFIDGFAEGMLVGAIGVTDSAIYAGVTRISVGKYGKGQRIEWGIEANPTFATEDKLTSHFEKHSGEFKGMFNMADEYLQGAQEVM